MRRKAFLLGLVLLAACGGDEPPDSEVVHDSAVVVEDTTFVDETELRGDTAENNRLARPAAPIARSLLRTMVEDTTAPHADGAQLFGQSCKMCHTGVGRDLKHFEFPRADIMRRALFHNSNEQAILIADYIDTLVGADTLTPDRIPFQPGNVVLASDVEFGTKLFGRDQWPANLTRDSLLRHNPSDVQVALRLMPWSDESSDYSWLSGVPHDPLQGIRNLQTVQTVLARYEADPTVESAIVVAKRVRNEAHNLANPEAPCRYPNDVAGFDAVRCGEVGDWIGTFLYVVCLDLGDLHGCSPRVSGEWWETGHLYHKAQQFRKFVPERTLQICGWMHAAFLEDRSLNKQSSYETGCLNDLGLPRQAIWVALRTQVERPSASFLACADAHSAAVDGFAGWAENALTFAYKELQYRATHNMLPTNRKGCADYVTKAQTAVGRYAPAVKSRLQPLASQTIAMILGG